MAAAVAQVNQVVARDAAIELGKALGDQRRVVDADAVEQAMDRADAIARCRLTLVELRGASGRECHAVPSSRTAFSSSTWSRVLP